MAQRKDLEGTEKLESMLDEKPRLAYCLGGLALAVAVRLYLFLDSDTINNDGVVYVELARHFWEGRWLEGLSGFYPPLFPLMIAAAFSLTGEWELAGRFWPLILSILTLFPHSYLPFLLLGWFLFLRGHFGRKKDFLLAVLIAFYCAAFPLLYVTRRYSVPLVPVSLGWVAAGALALWEYSNTGRPKVRYLLMGLVAIVFALGTLPKTLASTGREKLYFREAGLYLKSKPGNPTIFTHDGRVAFYARGSNHVRVAGVEEALASRVTAGTYLTLENKLLESTKRSLETMGWVREREFSGSNGDGLVILLLNRKAPE